MFAGCQCLLDELGLDGNWESCSRMLANGLRGGIGLG